MGKNLKRRNQTSQTRPARAEAEKKTSSLVAAGFLTAANTEFFNTPSHKPTFAQRLHGAKTPRSGLVN